MGICVNLPLVDNIFYCDYGTILRSPPQASPNPSYHYSPSPSPQQGAGTNPPYYYPNPPSYVSHGAGKPGKFGDAAVIEGKNWIKDMEAQAVAIGSNKNSKHMSELTKAEVKNELSKHDQAYINKFIIDKVEFVFDKKLLKKLLMRHKKLKNTTII